MRSREISKVSQNVPFGPWHPSTIPKEMLFNWMTISRSLRNNCISVVSKSTESKMFIVFIHGTTVKIKSTGLSHEPIPLLGKYPKEQKTGTQMFTHACSQHYSQ